VGAVPGPDSIQTGCLAHVRPIVRLLTVEVRTVTLSGQEPLGRHIQVVTAEGPKELDIYTEEGFQALAELWTRAGWERRLSYEVTWLGIPIIQLPEDIVILQELIWKVAPDVVIESGVAHGGALLLYASILELLRRGRVIGIDIEIRKYNRLAIESHPLSDRITLIEGSSTDAEVVCQVRSMVRPGDRVMVLLDSDHSAAHVSAELGIYAPLVSPGSYLVVFDSVMTLVSDAPHGKVDWVHDNPRTAVDRFLAGHPDFVRDEAYERLAVTYCHGGFLRRRDVPDRRPVSSEARPS
jgi:cephalosporin hydroxylase